jgi:RNA polymerase sigma-70 factor (ECF subfamily)
VTALWPPSLDVRRRTGLATLAAIALDPVDAEKALVARAQAGDRAALESLLRDHYGAVYAVCRRMAGNDADAADAAQEAMIAIARHLGRFDGRSSLSTWIYRIAVNATIDELRRRSRRPVVPLEEATAGVAPATDGVETRVDVDAALKGLPETLRAAVVLRDLCGLDYAEIAEVLDIPPGTVRSRIARGRAALVAALGPARAAP